MVISFASDIRPKFRPRDIKCMAARNIHLDDSQWMLDASATFGFADHGNARHVFQKLSSQEMPPDGPWPADWITLFEDWMTAGFGP